MGKPVLSNPLESVIMAHTATQVVVEEKRQPIAAATVTVPVVVTAQGLTEHFREFRKIGHDETKAGDKASAKKCAIIVACVLDGLKAPVPEQYNDALSGVIESTRVHVTLPDGTSKIENGRDTSMARKFASYCRAAFAAVKGGRMTAAALLDYSNSQKLYDDARELCEATADRPKLDRNGYETTPEQVAAKREAKVVDAARKFAAKRGLTSEQAAALVEQSKAGIKTAEAQSAAARLNKRAQTLADRIVEELGIDGGLAFVETLAGFIRAKQAAVVQTQQ
jgi:hypothetical protein